MTKLFCYGTLHLDHIQLGIWGELKEGKVATLHNFKLRSYTNGIFYVEPSVGDTVAGKIYELNQEQLAATDIYETKAYDRKTIFPIGEPSFDVYIKAKEKPANEGTSQKSSGDDKKPGV